MGKLISGLFGGAQRDAARKAQLENRVQSERALAAERSADSRIQLSRRNPRGRRLFADETVSNLPSTVA